jgi:hypothetical protein
MPRPNAGGKLPTLATARPSDVNLAVPGGLDTAEFDTSVSRIRATAREAVSRA